ncbi:uncharacterized protein LOC106154681 [Lingula anatina]|uniref:Uncharacterized protein LOC106154681 n=1 Tax=Lingula anatina TaxID=7574 RepID=A0A1S3HGH6_LINAN|nr:uncharacterized protein LOC106154681 [Lingula anatina]XP_013384577.1 uncharacterized protein LOC106154681 [Lingula anatina]XP_013384578.1 uncharacterized protein LOC106154681 [Lingula anatina]|eukprot:XP_013384576.1 uncharacterized protein LOC106154681 [Lingula anatina]
MAKRKLIIDVDTGVDDAQAIMMALACPDVDVLAITCVNGNTMLDQVYINTLRVLKTCDRMDIPVYKGTYKSLIGHDLSSEGQRYHGSDGLGDCPEAEPPYPNLIQTEHASIALLKLVNKYPGEITLVTLAPLTNIAVALRLEHNFTKKLKELFIMGGNIEGVGNVTTSAEFNFCTDPEAANVVLNEVSCPTYLVGWEVCLRHAQNWDWYEKVIERETKKAKFVESIMRSTRERNKNVIKRPFHSCDSLAMAVALRPDKIEESALHYCTVECRGELTRGQMVIDHRGLLKKDKKIKVVTKFDVRIFRELYEALFN